MDTDTDSDTDLSYEELRPFQCGKCCNRFITQNDLRFHTELVHSIGLYECAKCDFSCRGIGQITLHNQNHIRENRNLESYKKTPSQNSFRISKLQSNLRTRNGHINDSSSGHNSSDDEQIKITKIDESDKENKNNSYISESSSDSASDSDDISKNRKQHKIGSKIKKYNRPISNCSSTHKIRNIYESVASSNNLCDNVSVGENPEITNCEGEITNGKTEIDTCANVAQSKYNIFDSGSDFHDKSSDFENEENNVNETNKSPCQSAKNITSEYPKKDKFSLQLDIIEVSFKNNDNTVTKKKDTSKLLTAITIQDKNKEEKRFANVYKNTEKVTEIKCKDKQKNVKQMCKSHQTSDSENENKYRDKSGNKKQESSIYANEGEIRENEKILYKKRKISDGDHSKNEKQKPKSYSERHNSDPQRLTISDCKTASKNKILNFEKSEKTISHNKEISYEKKSNKKSDSENENKQEYKYKTIRDITDTERDNKLSYKSVSERKILNPSKFRKNAKDKSKSDSESSPEMSDSEYESKRRQKLKSSNSKIECKHKEKVKSSQGIQKSNAIKTNDASNKEKRIYDLNKVELKKAEEINENENNRKQNEEFFSNKHNHSEEQEHSFSVLKRKFDHLDTQNAVKNSKSCYLSGNNVPSLDSEKNQSIVVVSPKRLDRSETHKSKEKQPKNKDGLSFKEKDKNKQLTSERNSVNKLGKEVRSKGISEQNGIKIKTDDCNNVPKKYKAFFQNEIEKKSSIPMCKIPKENIKDMINNTKGTNTSERGKDTNITKIEEIDREIQQSEDVIVGNVVIDLNSSQSISPKDAKIKKIQEIERVILKSEDVIVENQPDYKCKTCNKTFERRRKLKKHLISGKCFGKGSEITQVDNKSSDRFVTDVNFPSTSKDLLNEINPYQETTHFNDKIDSKLKPISNKKSVYSTDKVEILMDRVEKIGNKFKCPECSKMLHSSGILRRHLIIHTGEMPFLCTSCDSTFNQKIQLQKHMKNAHNEGMFRCKICSENFVQEIYMQRHMAKHTGINPFPCSICPENFVLERDLKKHMRKDHDNWGKSNSIHYTADGLTKNSLNNEKESKDRKDTCIVTRTKLTNNKDKSVTTLKNKLIDTGETPFNCIKCNYTAAESIDFQNHLKNIHNEGIFKCKYCDETFSEKINLKSHILEHTSDKEMLNFDVSSKDQNQIIKKEISIKN